MFLYWFPRALYLWSSPEGGNILYPVEMCKNVITGLSSPFNVKFLLSVFLLFIAAELDAEHTQKVLEMEHAQQAKLKERQKYFEEAFQQDMEQYLSTGYLQIADRRGKRVIFFVCLFICFIVVY